MLKIAVTADLQFAAAYYNLAAAYASVGDDLHERESIAKAYSLNDNANTGVAAFGFSTSTPPLRS